LTTEVVALSMIDLQVLLRIIKYKEKRDEYAVSSKRFHIKDA
jgi:hypothetical protein